MNDRKINRPGLLVVAVSALVFSGCATAPRTGQSVTIQTGRVVASQPETLPSRAPSGAAIGGVVGFGQGIPRGKTVFNLFVEPQWSVADRRPGWPDWQVFAGFNMQFLQ